MGWLHLDMSVEAYTENSEGKLMHTLVRLPRPLIVELDEPFYYIFVANVFGPAIIEIDAHSCELADHIGSEIEKGRTSESMVKDFLHAIDQHRNDQRDGG